MLLFFFAALFGYGYILTPALAVYSWVRWSRSQRRKSRRVKISLLGLSVATVSLLVGIVVVAVSSIRHGVFLYIAPGHKVIYAMGLALSTISILLTALGALQNSPIRLKALVVALGTLSLWFLAGSGR